LPNAGAGQLNFIVNWLLNLFIQFRCSS
jgi:hypothetical protein